jgi:hypothetical protein
MAPRTKGGLFAQQPPSSSSTHHRSSLQLAQFLELIARHRILNTRPDQKIRPQQTKLPNLQYADSNKKIVKIDRFLTGTDPKDLISEVDRGLNRTIAPLKGKSYYLK